MTLATVASVVGIGAGGLSLFNQLKGGGSKPGGQAGNTYVPTDQGGADQGWQDFMRMMQKMQTDAGGQFNPAIMESFQKMLGMQPSIQGAGDVAGQQSIGLSNMAQIFRDMMYGKALEAGGAQTKMYGAGDQLWQTALDPQNKLRDRLKTETQQGARTADSTRGIGMGDESVGHENDAVGNFLMNWENNQLGRQAAGLHGMSEAYGQGANQGNLYGRDLTGSMDFGAMAPQFAWQSMMYPFMAAGMPIQAADQAGGAMNKDVYGPMGNFMNQMLAYMGMGQGASGQAFDQNQANWQNLIKGLNQGGPGGGNIWDSLKGLFSGGGSPAPSGGGSDIYFPYGGGGGYAGGGAY